MEDWRPVFRGTNAGGCGGRLGAPFRQPASALLGMERTTLIGLATFFGILWVLALGEEFLSAGCCNSGSRLGCAANGRGWLLAALLFGFVHCGIRRSRTGGSHCWPCVAGVVLRDGVPAGTQHPRIHGDARLTVPRGDCSSPRSRRLHQKVKVPGAECTRVTGKESLILPE